MKELHEDANKGAESPKFVPSDRLQRAVYLHRKSWRRFDFPQTSLNKYTLIFSSSALEADFQAYLDQLQENSMRVGLLVVNVLYMLYAIITWRGTGAWKQELAARATYVVLMSICFSFTFSPVYRHHKMIATSLLSSLTGLEIIVEGLIVEKIYSPLVIISLLVYFIISHSFIPVRFLSASIACWTILFVYDILALALFPNGDLVLERDQVVPWVVWYNMLVVSAIVGIMVMTRRLEINYRYDFLTHYDEEKNIAIENMHSRGSDPTPQVSFFDKFLRMIQGIEQNSTTCATCATRGGGVSPRNRKQRVYEYDALESEETNDLRDTKYRSSLQQRTEFELCAFDELPEYFEPYPFVRSHYRARFTPQLCLESLLRIHNETVNIYTEIVPLMFFTGCFVYEMYWNQVVITSTWEDQYFVGFALFGATIFRPFCSALAHTFYCQNRASYTFWWSVDYTSICLCILSISFMVGHFSFYCEYQQQIFYFISAVALFLSTIVSVLFVASHSIRAVSFVLFVSFAQGLPLVYQFYMKYVAEHPETYQDVPGAFLGLWFLVLLLFTIGLVIKSTKFPEVLHPGKYDILGASHQIWHICINLGFGCIYLAANSFLSWKSHNKCPGNFG